MKNLFENIKNINLDSSIIKELNEIFIEVFTKNEPIRIAVIGEAGVGKTSTINALFKTDLPISHIGTCTQKAEVVKAITSKGIPIEVIDMPGLWAGEAETQRHWETYKNVLPTVDSAIWVISAGDRALQGMQNALKTISEFADSNFVNHIVFGINKSEHMYDEKWNDNINLPSPIQQEHLELFCLTVKDAIIEKFPGWKGKIVCYSAQKNFRLDELLEQMVASASPEKRLKVIKAADPTRYEDTIEDKRALAIAKKMIEKEK